MKFQVVENMHTTMKEVEKRLTKMNSAAAELSAEATTLATILKKHAQSLDGHDSRMVKEIGKISHRDLCWNFLKNSEVMNDWARESCIFEIFHFNI